MKIFNLIIAAMAAISISAVAEVPEHVPGEVIVKFKDGVHSVAQISAMGAESVTTFRSSGAQLLRLPMIMSAGSIIDELNQRDDVEYAEYNEIYYLNAMPNDSKFDQLFGLHNTGSMGIADADIDAPEAWDITTGSKDIVVGVIDTGIDYKHRDLRDNIFTNPGETGVDANGDDMATNGIDDDNNGFVDDVHGWDFINNDNDPMDGHGHGTHVAGTIGATGNNGEGVVGVNWEVSLMPAKIFDDSGRTNLAAIINAIEYTTMMGVHATNNSWGGGGKTQSLLEAIEEADQKEILFIAAAGNATNDNDKRAFYPAGYELDNIISVASTDSRDRLSSFSNYGKTTVDVAAPGSNIHSTWPGDGYRSISGTSMAAPHVTGLVALVYSQFPNADYQEIRDRVENSCDSKSALKSRTICGGRINAYTALTR